MSWMSTVTIGILAAAGLCYVALALTLFLLQRKLIYKPDPRRTTPEACGFPGVEALTLSAPDAAKIAAWYVRAEPGRPTVLYFHGARGWIELRNERLAALKSRGFGVMMLSYRGFGGSTGQPSEAANVADAKLGYGALLARGVRPRDIVLFGESLGSGVATQLAATRPVHALVLDSPYTSMTDLALLRYPWLPVSLLLRDRYETTRHLRAVRAPVMVIHGAADALVPLAMGRAVHAAASEPKALVVVPGAGHLDHLEDGSFDRLSSWLDDLPPGAAIAEPEAVAGERKRPEAVPQAYVVAKV